MRDDVAPPVRASLVYDGVYTLGGRLVRTVLALAMGVLVARLLGPYQRGLYALPTAVYTGLLTSALTGISVAVSYFMLTTGAGRAILRPALVASALFSAAGALAVIFAAALAHNAWAIAPGVLLLPANAAGMVLLGYAVGSKQIRWQTTYAVVSTAALLAGVGGALAVFAHTAAVAVTAFVAVNAAIGIGSLYIVIRDAGARDARPVALAPFVMYALRSALVNVITQLNYRADLYVVAILASAAVLGQYAVAISAAEGMLVVTAVASIVTSPHVGGMESDDAALLTARCVRATLLLSAPLCAALFALAAPIVHLLYGSAYLPLVPALRILLVAVLVLSLGSPISNYFTLNRGKPEVALLSATCAAGVCLALSWVLVPRIGMVGAAAATAFAYLLGEGMRMAFFIRASGLPLREVLVPTRADLHWYASTIKTIGRDAARLRSTLRAARL